MPNFQKSLKFKTVLPCSYWSSDFELRFDQFLIWIWEQCPQKSFSSLNLFSNGIRFTNFGLMELKLWFFKQCYPKLNFPYIEAKNSKVAWKYFLGIKPNLLDYLHIISYLINELFKPNHCDEHIHEFVFIAGFHSLAKNSKQNYVFMHVELWNHNAKLTIDLLNTKIVVLDRYKMKIRDANHESKSTYEGNVAIT